MLTAGKMITLCNAALLKFDALEAAASHLPEEHLAFVFTGPRVVTELRDIAHFETVNHVTLQQVRHINAVLSQIALLERHIKEHCRGES